MELLLTFRKAQEDLRKSVRAETEKISPTVDSLNYYASRDAASAKKAEIIDNINSFKSKHEILVEVDGRQQNLRWVEGQIDELDIDIALQMFKPAVAKVEKLRDIAKGLKGNSIAQELITVKVDERAYKMAYLLSRELSDRPAFPEATKRTVNFVTRLGFEDLGREVYLRARTDDLVKRARQCVFEGDLHRYVFQISYVYFTIIKNTVLIYQSCFPTAMTSACIKWAGDHLLTFNSILNRQMSTVDREGKAWRECMDVVWGHEHEMLSGVGLDFRAVIGKGLEEERVPPPSKPTNYDRSHSRSKSRVQTPNETNRTR